MILAEAAFGLLIYGYLGSTALLASLDEVAEAHAQVQATAMVALHDSVQAYGEAHYGSLVSCLRESVPSTTIPGQSDWETLTQQDGSDRYPVGYERASDGVGVGRWHPMPIYIRSGNLQNDVVATDPIQITRAVGDYGSASFGTRSHCGDLPSLAQAGLVPASLSGLAYTTWDDSGCGTGAVDWCWGPSRIHFRWYVRLLIHSDDDADYTAEGATDRMDGVPRLAVESLLVAETPEGQSVAEAGRVITQAAHPSFGLVLPATVTGGPPLLAGVRDGWALDGFQTIGTSVVWSRPVGRVAEWRRQMFRSIGYVDDVGSTESVMLNVLRATRGTGDDSAVTTVVVLVDHSPPAHVELALHRADTGLPDLNRMRTSFDFGGYGAFNTAYLAGVDTDGDGDTDIGTRIFSGEDIPVQILGDLHITGALKVGGAPEDPSADVPGTLETPANLAVGNPAGDSINIGVGATTPTLAAGTIHATTGAQLGNDDADPHFATDDGGFLVFADSRFAGSLSGVGDFSYAASASLPTEWGNYTDPLGAPRSRTRIDLSDGFVQLVAGREFVAGVQANPRSRYDRRTISAGVHVRRAFDPQLYSYHHSALPHSVRTFSVTLNGLFGRLGADHQPSDLVVDFSSVDPLFGEVPASTTYVMSFGPADRLALILIFQPLPTGAPNPRDYPTASYVEAILGSPDHTDFSVSVFTPGRGTYTFPLVTVRQSTFHSTRIYLDFRSDASHTQPFRDWVLSVPHAEQMDVAIHPDSLSPVDVSGTPSVTELVGPVTLPGDRTWLSGRPASHSPHLMGFPRSFRSLLEDSDSPYLSRRLDLALGRYTLAAVVRRNVDSPRRCFREATSADDASTHVAPGWVYDRSLPTCQGAGTFDDFIRDGDSSFGEDLDEEFQAKFADAFDTAANFQGRCSTLGADEIDRAFPTGWARPVVSAFGTFHAPGTDPDTDVAYQLPLPYLGWATDPVTGADAGGDIRRLNDDEPIFASATVIRLCDFGVD